MTPPVSESLFPHGFACRLVEVCVAAPSPGSPNARSALQAKAVVHHVQHGIICIRFCWLKYLLDQTHTGGLCSGPVPSAPTHCCCCLCLVSYHRFPLCSAILYYNSQITVVIVFSKGLNFFSSTVETLYLLTVMFVVYWVWRSGHLFFIIWRTPTVGLHIFTHHNSRVQNLINNKEIRLLL